MTKDLEINGQVTIEPQVFAVVLGTMQDAGLPHIGCRCARCKEAYNEPRKANYASCLGIVDDSGATPKTWLIDATPDIKHQMNLLADYLEPAQGRPDRLKQPEGIFLTHAHMGHTAGLAQLGPEGMNVSQLAIYGTNEMMDLVRSVTLWQPLIKNLQFKSLVLGQSVDLSAKLTVLAIPVGHRDEVGSGTMAYLCQGPSQALLYVPDIDDWHSFSASKEMLPATGIALIDATFYKNDELYDRWDVPHPTAFETIEFWSGYGFEVWLTHLNHTNPLLDKDGEAQKLVRSKGFNIAHTGQIIPL